MAAYQERRQRKKATALAIRKGQALEEVQALVGKFLSLDPGITKIILFGSLARDDVSSLDSEPTRFHPDWLELRSGFRKYGDRSAFWIFSTWLKRLN